MIEVNLFDREFIHTESLLGYITCSDTLKPTKIKWVNGLLNFSGITVFTDRFVGDPVVDLVKCKLKVLLIIEPRAVNPNSYNKVLKYEDKFDYILTYDSHLLQRNSKYLKYVVGQSRIKDEESFIYEKTKLVSMIASNKTLTIGHNFRHFIAHKFSNRNIDFWGSAYKQFDSKLSALKDYLFSISIMNSRVDNFFTEILLDNFRVGTIPIFWGCPNIKDFFDINGIITFETIEELENILQTISIETYNNLLPAVKNNFELVKKYISTDDMIAEILVTLNK